MPAKPPCQLQPPAPARTLSGRRLDILSPSPLDIEDIAHGSARDLLEWPDKG